MARIIFLLIPLMFLFLTAGCGKRPAPETVPSPMTEAYLLKHMQVIFDNNGSTVIVRPPELVTHPRFLDDNSTVTTLLAANATLDQNRSVSVLIPVRYRMLFSLRAGAWGGFTEAIDTSGASHEVSPYTSYIRKGIFYDNFYVDVTRAWLETAAQEETSLLFLGPIGEIAVALPAVYPRALVHFIDAGTFLSDTAPDSSESP